jgi:hypothetical protein
MDRGSGADGAVMAELTSGTRSAGGLGWQSGMVRELQAVAFPAGCDGRPRRWTQSQVYSIRGATGETDDGFVEIEPQKEGVGT